MITETTLRQRIATRIEPQTMGLDTPIELTPVPKFDPYKRQVSFGVASGSLAPIEFPTREVSRVTKVVCAAADFERDHPMVAWAIVVAISGAVMLGSALIGGVR